MTSTLPTFTPLEESLWLTLVGRALDHRRADPILDDALADEIVRKLNYDWEKYKLSASPILNIAHRSKKLDEVAAGFIERYPNAIGLDLGAGLDTRAFRIDPPTTVDWYDVDFPAVVAARVQLIPKRPHIQAIGADVTSQRWLDELPNDRPAVIVADGLMAFLEQEDFVALLRRLTAHFPHGEIAFNGYSTFAIWAAKHYHGTQSVAPLIKSPGFDDPHEPERWVPKLKLAREILLTREPEVAKFPPALRAFTRFAAHFVGWSRRGTTVLQYRF